MNENDPVIEYGQLHQSMAPLVWTLLGCTVVAALWVGVPTAGVGWPVAAIVSGIWGTAFGFMGLKRSLQRGIQENNVTLLPPAHPLVEETHRLCRRLGMPARPLVGTMPAHNAYAIGSSPEDSLVVIGEPLIKQLTPEELSAVIAHELGHIANNDMRRMGLARSFQKSLTWYFGRAERLQRAARWSLSWATELAILRLSRKREYWADAIGAALTSPEAMRSALAKICNAPVNLTSYESANARMMFRGKGSSWLSTHPTLEQRDQALAAGTYIGRLPHIRMRVKLNMTPDIREEKVPAPAIPQTSAGSDLAY